MDKNLSPPSKKRRIGESLGEAQPLSTEKSSIISSSLTRTCSSPKSTSSPVAADNVARASAEHVVPRQERQQQQQQQQQQQHELPPLDTPRLYIGGLHPRITQTHVEKLMMPYGAVQDVRLVVKQQQGNGSNNNNNHAMTTTTTNFAFCHYALISQAQAAMKALNGRSLLGKRLLVRPANQQQHTSHHQSAFNRRYETHRDQQQQQLKQQSSSSGVGSFAPNTGNSSRAASASASGGGDTRQDKQEIKKIDSRIEAIKRKLQKPSSSPSA